MVTGKASLATMGLLYAALYASVGITLPYLPQHLRALGLNGTQIGRLMSLAPMMTVVVPLLFGYLADRSKRGAALLSALLFGCTLAFVPMLAATDFASLLPWMTLGAFCNAPLSMLADSLTLERLAGRVRDYPRVRLWGSLGFIVTATGFGFLYSGERSTPPLVIVAALATTGLGFLVSLLVRGRGEPSTAAHASEAAKVFRDGRIRLLLAATCLHWLACSPYHLLFTVHLKDLGLGPSIAGLGLGAGVLAEVSMLALFPRLGLRFSPRVFLVAAFVGSALRWALIAETSSAVPMVALQLLHGLTFGAFMASSVTYLDAVAPKGLRATAQAAFVSVTYGVGGFVGSLLVGAAFDHFPAPAIFRAGAVLECLPALIVFFLPAAPRPTPAPPVLGSAEVPP